MKFSHRKLIPNRNLHLQNVVANIKSCAANYDDDYNNKNDDSSTKSTIFYNFDLSHLS